MGPTEKLARFLTGLSYEHLPQEVVQRAKGVVLDTLGAGIFGSHMPWGRIVSEFVEETGGAPEALVWATPLRVPAVNAALANGNSGHGFELDDYHSGAKIHPGVAVVPAALATAEAVGASGPDLITAVVAGYEACIRASLVSITSTWGRGYHATGVFGGFGAAAASASLLRLDELQVRNALGLAATQAAGLLMAAVAEGAMSKRFHAGKSAANGVLSARLAQKGFTAPTRVFEAPEGSFYKAYADQWDLRQLTDGLGEGFAILDCTYKPYTCCGSNHSSIDCILALRRAHGLTANDVERVVLKNSRIVKEQTGWDYQPGTVFTAQMSIKYAVAVALLEGQVFVDQYREELLADPRVLDLTRRTDFEVDPELDRIYPTRFPAIVEVHLRNGQVLAHRVEGPTGSPQNPLDHQGVQDKFRAVTRSRLAPDAIVGVIQDVDRLESLEDVRQLAAHLQPAAPVRP